MLLGNLIEKGQRLAERRRSPALSNREEDEALLRPRYVVGAHRALECALKHGLRFAGATEIEAVAPSNDEHCSERAIVASALEDRRCIVG